MEEYVKQFLAVLKIICDFEFFSIKLKYFIEQCNFSLLPQFYIQTIHSIMGKIYTIKMLYKM